MNKARPRFIHTKNLSGVIWLVLFEAYASLKYLAKIGRQVAKRPRPGRRFQIEREEQKMFSNRWVALATLFVLFFVGFAATASAQHDPKAVFNPSPDSPTALRNCGVTEERLRSEGYVYRYEFTGEERLEWVEGCRNGKIFRDTHGHPVAPGTIGWLKAERSREVAFPGCLNRGRLRGEVEIRIIKPELEPTPPPAPPKPVELPPVAGPGSCTIYPVIAKVKKGESATFTAALEERGNTVTATRWLVDWELVSQKGRELTRPFDRSATVIFQWEDQLSRRVECAAAVEVEEVAVAPPPEKVEEIPPPARRHPWWHWLPPIVCVDIHRKADIWKPVACTAVAGLAWWLWPVEKAVAPVVGFKLPVPVISPP